MGSRPVVRVTYRLHVFVFANLIWLVSPRQDVSVELYGVLCCWTSGLIPHYRHQFYVRVCIYDVDHVRAAGGKCGTGLVNGFVAEGLGG